MTIQEVIATVKTINEVYEAEMTKRKAEVKALIDVSTATLDAYYDDVRKKEKTISNRIAALNGLLTANGNQSAEAQKNYTLAVVKNDNAKMKSLQEQLRELAEEKLSITAQIEALQLVNVKGDKTLYDTAIKAKDTGVIGASVAGLTAYTAVTRLAAAATTILVGTVPGVNVIMGVTMAVAGITAGVAALADVSESAVPTVDELTEASRNMQDVMDGATSTYDDAVASTVAASNVADDYISKLEDMGDYAALSADKQKELWATLATAMRRLSMLPLLRK